jgi:DNA modification methylase
MSVLLQENGKNWHMYNADCLELLAQLPDNSIDFSVYSPPYAGLYIYSPSERDHGNNTDEGFVAIYAQVCKQLLRVTKPGRNVSIHVKDLVFYSGSNEQGARGLKPFTDWCVKAHMDAGWTYHSKVTVWRCPVLERAKSNPDGLLYKNFKADSARVRQGMAEYIVTFRKWADGMEDVAEVVHDENEFPLSIWQQWASPVWNDTNATDVLNALAKTDEEAHICCMPLDLTERCIRLWSNPNDVVLSPYGGIGSEGVVAMRTGRKFVGVELNPKYYHQAVKNIKIAEGNGQKTVLI